MKYTILLCLLWTTTLLSQDVFEYDTNGTSVDETSTDGTSIENGTDQLGCFLVLVRNYELYELLETIKNVQDRFNNKFNYPYVFLNDKPFTKQFTNAIENFLPNSVTKFGTIPENQWSVPNFIDQNKLSKSINDLVSKNVVYGDLISYRNMCRYYSGFFQSHPLVQNYEYYWRLEPGVKLTCDIDIDIFHEMKLQNKKYAFTILMFEYDDTIPSLWSHFQTFKSLYPEGELIDLVNNEGSYNLCHFWSNFEIARFDIFTSPTYQNYFQYLDSTGGFFYERWGDAPIHTLYIANFLNKNDLWYLDFIGYCHPPYCQCPKSNTWFQRKCFCDPEFDFTDSFQSCANHFNKVLNS